jgi:hypothetical protein
MAKKNTKLSWDNLSETVFSELKWGEGQTSSPHQNKTVIIKSTGQGDPDEQIELLRLAEDPDFKAFEDAGITKEDMARYIRLMQEKHSENDD